MAEHARLSPSAAEQWMTCPGSVQLSEQFPDETSIHAAEGTAAHSVRERCLKSGLNVVDLLGERIVADEWEFQVTQDWVNWLQPGIDFVREQPGESFIEYRVDLSAWMPGQFGTLDTGIITSEIIFIDDLKFGRGVIVDAERNKQLMIYAAGFWENVARHRTNATKFRLIVDQPRGQGGTWREWDCTLDDILKFMEEVSAAAKLTEDHDAPLKVSSKGCQFCRVASNFACPAMHEFCFDLLGGLELPEIDQLTPDRRSEVVKHAPLVKKWLESAHSLHLDHALKGLPTPGFKAVATQGDRTWADEEKAEEFWKAKMPAKDIYTQKLKSPAQMEKVAGTRNWAKAQELITRPDGKPALVPLSDKREPLVPILSLLPDLDESETTDEFDDLI